MKLIDDALRSLHCNYCIIISYFDHINALISRCWEKDLTERLLDCKLEPCRSTNRLGKLSNKKATVGHGGLMYQQPIRNQSQAGSKVLSNWAVISTRFAQFLSIFQLKQRLPLKDFRKSNSKITFALRSQRL